MTGERVNGGLVRRLLVCATILAALNARASGTAGRSPLSPGEQRQVPPRDRMPAPQSGSATIKGRIVDGLTGRPVWRARVRLYEGPAGPKGPLLTEADGRFSFGALPPGTYSVVAEKAGYLPSRYPDSERSLRNHRRSLTLRAGETLDDLTVRIFAGAVIAGRILDPYGDPVDNANVSVLSMPRQGLRAQSRAGGMSNDLGEFRIPRLPAGRYFLRVTPQLTHQPVEAGEPLLAPELLPARFPASAAVGRSPTIALGRGETVSGIEIVLSEGIPSTIYGAVVASDGQPIAGGNVSARMLGASDTGGFDHGVGLNPDGGFQLQLPPGEFLLSARAYPRPAPNQSRVPAGERFGTLRMAVPGGTVESVSILLARGATASGRVVFEGSAFPPPPPASVPRVPMFNSDDPTCRGGPLTVNPDWTFRVEGLTGTCLASPAARFGRWLLKGLTLQGQNVLDTQFTFEEGRHYGNLEVVVTDRRPQVDLVVTDELGELTRDYAALAIPVEKERWAQLAYYVRAFSPDPRSRTEAPARFPEMAPGEYYVIAVDDMDPDDAYDPAVLERLIGYSTKILASDSAPLEVPLRRVPFASIVR